MNKRPTSSNTRKRPAIAQSHMDLIIFGHVISTIYQSCMGTSGSADTLAPIVEDLDKVCI